MQTKQKRVTSVKSKKISAFFQFQGKLKAKNEYFFTDRKALPQVQISDKNIFINTLFLSLHIVTLKQLKKKYCYFKMRIEIICLNSRHSPDILIATQH